MKIVVLGETGLIGSKVVASLTERRRGGRDSAQHRWQPGHRRRGHGGAAVNGVLEIGGSKPIALDELMPLGPDARLSSVYSSDWLAHRRRAHVNRPARARACVSLGTTRLSRANCYASHLSDALAPCRT